MDVISYLLGKKSGGGGTPALQNKSITITENGTTNVTADTGYDGLSQVEVTTNVSGGGADEYNVFAAVPEGYTGGALALTNYIKKVGTFDTSSIQNMSGMFSGCRNLKTVELLDTENVTSFSRMFYNCTNIENIPQFDTTSVTDFSSMFLNVGNHLTDESLNNILGMCANAVSYTGTKTLATLALYENRAPIARLQVQPNYQDFLDAGWTIGY